MSTIKAVLIANTKAWGKIGDTREITPAELVKYPHIFRAQSDIAAEEAQKQAQAVPSSQEWHQQQRAALRAERARIEEQQALLAADRAKVEQERAEAAAERARVTAADAAQAAELEALRSENERLRALQAQKEAADRALSELRPSPPASPGTPAPEPPKEEPPAPKPHERRRDR